MNILGTLRASQLRQAADILERIEGLKQQLSELLGSTPETEAVPEAAPHKRKISAAGIARIRAAQKARWAKVKGTAALAQPKPKRKMSPAATARLAAIARARWKKAKAAGKSRL